MPASVATIPVVADSWVEKLRRDPAGEQAVLDHFTDILGELMPKTVAATSKDRGPRPSASTAGGLAEAVRLAARGHKGSFRIF
jgi:hypothetical protein